MSSPIAKMTCFINGTKKHIYLPTPKRDFYFSLLTAAENTLRLGGVVNYPDFRIYWIDEDFDEIEINGDSHVKIFYEKNLKPHLYVEIEKLESEHHAENASANADDMFPTKDVHTHVECDMCKVKPIVGFRYKCIQCLKFDLCQHCEAKHCHSEHMLVRMPHDHCPNVIEQLIQCRAHPCPFVPPTPDLPSAAPDGGDAERHHHVCRDMQSGLLRNLNKIMKSLAEGGVPNGEVSTPTERTSESFNANAATAAIIAAANVAANAAANAASCAAAAFAAAEKAIATIYSAKIFAEKQETTGAAPKATSSTQAGTQPTADLKTFSLLGSLTLESLCQFIDPQNMRADIQILNSFRQMFDKMLDPAKTVEFSCPFDATAGNGTRKNSNTLNASSSSALSTTGNSVPASAEPVTPPTVPQSEITETNADMPTKTSATKNLSSPQSFLTAENRSQSIEDNDCQLIDNQPTTTTPTENIVSSETVKSPAQPIDFVQLSKDLKEEEMTRENSKKQTSQTSLIELRERPSTSTTTTNVTPNVTPVPTAISSIVPPASIVPSAPVPQLRVGDYRPAVFFYHPVPRVNNAVHAMMAMGFSNEGAWLTKLMESVNGNISEALDLMSAAQRDNI